MSSGRDLSYISSLDWIGPCVSEKQRPHVLMTSNQYLMPRHSVGRKLEVVLIYILFVKMTFTDLEVDLMKALGGGVKMV